MTTETTTDQTPLRPAFAPPAVLHEYSDDDWDLENPINPRVGWSLSWGCRLTFGYDDDVLHVTVSTSDQDQRDGITKRAVTREQLADYGRKLLTLAGVDTDELEQYRDLVARLTAELEHAKSALAGDNEGVRLWMTDCAKVSDRLRAELSGALAEVKRLTAENVLLRGELRITEDERDNARLDVEADVRAELAAKAGA